MIGQKAAIVEAVKNKLGARFTPYRDIALMLLTHQELEDIKLEIATGILNSLIDYGKDRNNVAEVHAYSRSCVMNHLKKARELNGGSSLPASSSKKTKTLEGQINTDILTDELKQLLNDLV